VKPRNFCSILLVCVLSCSWLQGPGQMDPRLQVLYSHFVGVWVGTYYGYREPKIVTSPVRVVITIDAKRERLRWEYTYGTKGQKSYDHLVRFMAIDPAKSWVTINQAGSEWTYKAGDLKELLDTGYGIFHFAGAEFQFSSGSDVVSLGTYEIKEDSLYYCWAETSNRVDFSTRAEWKLTRESAANGPADAKPSP
jgi:hypothetical protein